MWTESRWNIAGWLPLEGNRVETELAVRSVPGWLEFASLSLLYDAAQYIEQRAAETGIGDRIATSATTTRQASSSIKAIEHTSYGERVGYRTYFPMEFT